MEFATTVEIYSTPTCPDCKAAKDYFNQHKIPFIEHDIDKNPKEAEELRERTGKMLVPTLIINEKTFFGFAFNRSEIEQLLAVPAS